MSKNPRELRNDDFLKVIFVGGMVKFYQIRKVDHIFYKDVHSSLASDGTESYANITNLDPPIDQLYYFWSVEIDGNVRFQLKQPAATNRWGTNRSPEGGYLFDVSSPVTSDRNMEIWCSENYPPAVQLVNRSAVAVIPVLWWIGYRMSVIEVPADQARNYTAIQIGGVAE